MRIDDVADRWKKWAQSNRLCCHPVSAIAKAYHLNHAFTGRTHCKKSGCLDPHPLSLRHCVYVACSRLWRKGK
jgi:hypothetical protein